MAMEFSVWSNYYADLSPEEAFARLKAHGINASEMGTTHGQMLAERDEDVRKTGTAFKKYLDELGMKVTQGHLWLQARIVSNPEAVDIIKRWIDLYEAVGIKNMVLHMDVYNMEDKSVEELHDLNVAKLKELAAHIEGRDIFICLENLFRRGSEHICQLLEIIDRVGSGFGITLDTGHLNMVRTTTQREFILTAGKKLRAIHIADNEGDRDQHLIPFGRGNVDFCEVVAALKEVGYEGLFNFEIPGEARGPLEVRDAKLAYVAEVYRYLMENA